MTELREMELFAPRLLAGRLAKKAQHRKYGQYAVPPRQYRKNQPDLETFENEAAGPNEDWFLVYAESSAYYQAQFKRYLDSIKRHYRRLKTPRDHNY